MKRLTLTALVLAMLTAFAAPGLAQDSDSAQDDAATQQSQQADGAQQGQTSPLTPDDFRPANPFRAQRSYHRFQRQFENTRIHLRKSIHSGYETWVNIITRNTIKNRIQWEIDEYNVTDPDRIQQIIDFYAPVTPSRGNVVLDASVRAGRMDNRVFQNFMEELPQHIHLVYGNKKYQKKLDRVLDQAENNFEPISAKHLHYKKFSLDPNASYQHAIPHDVRRPATWNPAAKAYNISLEYTADEDTIEDIREYLKRDGEVGLWVVLSDPHYFNVRKIKDRNKASVLNQISPDLLAASDYALWLDDDYTDREEHLPRENYKPERDTGDTSRSMTGEGY